MIPAQQYRYRIHNQTPRPKDIVIRASSLRDASQAAWRKASPCKAEYCGIDRLNSTADIDIHKESP